MIESLVGVVEKTEFGAKLVFEVNVPEDLRLPVAGEDLLEIAGALIENAARYARRRVRITGRSRRGGLLIVEDDGPGIESGAGRRSADARRTTRRGRLRATAWASPSLTILSTPRAAQITLLRSDLGGLKVCIAWSAQSARAA